jgi:hypothetical protein
LGNGVHHVEPQGEPESETTKKKSRSRKKETTDCEDEVEAVVPTIYLDAESPERTILSSETQSEKSFDEQTRLRDSSPLFTDLQEELVEEWENVDDSAPLFTNIPEQVIEEWEDVDDSTKSPRSDRSMVY